MRLIDADALKSKIREQPWKQETKVSLMLDWIYMLIDEAPTVQIGAMQQENEKLKSENERLRTKLDDWKYEAQCHMDEVLARDKELEQLQAQAARMKESLDKIVNPIKYMLKGAEEKGKRLDGGATIALSESFPNYIKEVIEKCAQKENTLEIAVFSMDEGYRIYVSVKDYSIDLADSYIDIYLDALNKDEDIYFDFKVIPDAHFSETSFPAVILRF